MDGEPCDQHRIISDYKRSPYRSAASPAPYSPALYSFYISKYRSDLFAVCKTRLEYIPWSYVAHDELYNLTPTTKNVNSSKSNRLPTFYKNLEEILHPVYNSAKNMGFPEWEVNG